MIRWFHKHLAFSIIAVVTLVGLGLTALLLPGLLSSWRKTGETRLLADAHAAFERGDLQTVAMTCNQVLKTDPNSVDACRLMMGISEQASSPQAIRWAMKTANQSHGDPGTF
jgi:hypothetical protein